MNGARPYKSFFIQSPSYETRPFLKSSAVKTPYRAPWVPTINRKFPTSNTKFSIADLGNKEKAGSSQNNIDDKGYWDSGCSRHMTGNISYLFDYEPFDEGYVSFSQGGCKITDKGTIKTELLKKEKGELETKLTGFQTASKDLDSLLESQRLNKNKEGLGYSVVPPPPAQVYSPPKKDLSWTGLREFADDTVTDYSRPAPTIESSPDDAQNRNPSVT
nr:hypothetical protein [Tanacetum cinerariifolium]